MVVEEKLIRKMEQFLLECKESHIRPTVIFIGEAYINIFKKRFSRLIEDNHFLLGDSCWVPIIQTKENYLGAGLVYGEFNIEDEEKVCLC